MGYASSQPSRRAYEQMIVTLWESKPTASLADAADIADRLIEVYGKIHGDPMTTNEVSEDDAATMLGGYFELFSRCGASVVALLEEQSHYPGRFRLNPMAADFSPAEQAITVYLVVPSLDLAAAHDIARLLRELASPQRAEPAPMQVSNALMASMLAGLAEFAQ